MTEHSDDFIYGDTEEKNKYHGYVEDKDKYYYVSNGKIYAGD